MAFKGCGYFKNPQQINLKNNIKDIILGNILKGIGCFTLIGKYKNIMKILTCFKRQ